MGSPPPLKCDVTVGAAKQPAGCNLGLLVRIEAMVVLCCLILAVLVFLGSIRRRSGNALIRLLIWASFTVTYPVSAYTIGLMQSSPLQHQLYVVWSGFFLFVFASADSITAYTVANIKSQVSALMNRGLQVIYVTVLLQYYSDGLSIRFKIYLCIMWFVTLVKIYTSVRCYRHARRSDKLAVDNKLIADYMTYEHHQLSDGAEPAEDPATMEGYKYIVMGEEMMDLVQPTAPHYVNKIELNDTLVTIDKVWQCKGSLLSSRSDAAAAAAAAARRDLCLSFALFKLLRRRCSNYPLSESGLLKTRDFVLKGLLQLQGEGQNKNIPQTRAFRVIEVELGFLYDLFYTKYPSICHPTESTKTRLVLFVVEVTLCVLTLFSSSLRHYQPIDHKSIIVNGVNLDVVLTMSIIVLVIILETYQFVVVVFSDWQKVRVLSNYVLNKSWQANPILELLLSVQCHCGNGGYWKKQMGQYSIIGHASPGRGHPVKRCLSRITLRSLDRFMTNIRSVKVSSEVEKELARALIASDHGVLGDGRASLRRNGVAEQLGWACGRETCAHTILIWHIATSLCGIQAQVISKSSASMGREARKDHHAVATSLSRYCAHLVSSAPELLPDHKYTTQTIVDSVLLELRGCLYRCATDEEVFAELMVAATEPEPADSIHVLGARLGAQLIEEVPDVEARWKVLAELWAELMLFVTPADNATAHVEHLTMGGELITHLWALLTHAGIVDRTNSASQLQFV